MYFVGPLQISWKPIIWVQAGQLSCILAGIVFLRPRITSCGADRPKIARQAKIPPAQNFQSSLGSCLDILGRLDPKREVLEADGGGLFMPAGIHGP